MDFSSIKLGKVNMNKYSDIEEISSKDIAIIGMACEFGSAKNADEFWANLRAGVDLVREFPDVRRLDTDDFLRSMNMDKTEYQEGAFLDEVDKFDYTFFRLSPKEAALMSPNQRLFLETAWKTIEDAGYGGNKLNGSKTGVYIGFEADAPVDYKRFIEELDPSSIPLAVPGNLTPIIASRIAYLLDLKGPSMSIDTACSSALVAIHTAIRAIRNGECEMAIAGSVRINILPAQAQFKLGIESSDGRTKAFDDSSDGTGSGEGTAAVLLKPLSAAIRDRDNIYAVIKGSAVNQDGRSIGITAPNVLAQEDVIVSAWKDAGIDPLSISYIEAHGTGTKLGDPIEVDGIRRAFRRYTDKKQFVPIGSVKTNIGHLDNAAGIAGLIKCVLALKYAEIPPSIHFKTPNSKIDFADSPVFVNDKLKEWKTEEYPKRCGISSFGFSGTNCHLILEEAPVSKITKGTEKRDLYFLALSAKSQSCLVNLIERYKAFLEKEVNVDIADICFTANTGRGHYNYRLAVIFESLEELKQKLGSAALKTDEAKNIYYAYHKIVSEIKENKADWEITDSVQKEISTKVSSEISEFISDRKNVGLLEKICCLYVKGADVEFEKLYKDELRSRVGLPVYPFERSRCWIEVAKNVKINDEKNSIGALVDCCRLKSMNLEVFSKEFDSERNWILKEHKISGNNVLVGTAYLEMVMQTFGKSNKGCPIEMKDIVFLTPLVMNSHEKREVQLIINKEDENYKFTAVSNCDAENENWSKHIEGRASALKSCRALLCDVDEIKKSCNEEVITPNINDYNDKTVFELGLRWGSIRKIYVGENQLLSHIELDGEFESELEDYTLYPSLLDNALTTIPLIRRSLKNSSSNLEDSIFLPFSYGLIKVYRALPSKFYSHVTSISNISEDSQTVSFNISLIDMSGEVLVEIENYSLKKMRSAKGLQQSNDKLFHQTRWINCEIETKDRFIKKENILVFSSKSRLECEMVDRLRQGGCSVIEVFSGNAYEEICSERYMVGSNIEDYKKVVSQIKLKGISKIIHAMTLADEEASDISVLKESMARGVGSLFRLAKAVQNINLDKHLDIVVISDYVNEVSGNEKIIKPENAALFGLAKVVDSENPKVSFRCIDIDNYTRLDDIFPELMCDGGSSAVAYRQGKRYIEELGEFDIENIKKREIMLHEEGAYIITGGLGGIALEVAQYLSSKSKVNLVLIGRTDMPERSAWDDIVGLGNDLKIINKINVIRRIEAKGSNVTIFRADVSDIKKMSEVVEKTRQKFGRINGVIHSAGQAGEGFLINKNEKVFDSVLAPKVEGTWILDKLTDTDELDFFVLFSSSTTLAGIVGQGDYTAANAYLDSYAAYRNKKGRKSLTIKWSAWKETGMAFNYGVNSDGFFKVLPTQKAIYAFGQVLNRDIERVFIGEINFRNQSFDQQKFPL